MKLGVMEIFQQAPGSSPKKILDDAIALAKLAEELGYESYWMAEHHFSDYGIMGSPLLMAAVIAQHTTRIKIGVAVLVLPFYDPVRLAEEIAIVDWLSDGRLQIGVGRGYQPAEFRGFRVDQTKSRAIADEMLEVMKLAWTQDNFTFDGEFYKIDGLTVLPRPMQQPHPPVYHAAVSMDSFRIAGEAGKPILTSPNFTPISTVRKQMDIYTSSLSEAGYDPASFNKPLMQKVYIGVDERDAYDTPKEAAMSYHRQLAKLVVEPGKAPPKGYEKWTKISENMEALTYDQVFEQGSIFATADVAVEKLKELKDAGVDKFLAWPRFGGMDHESAMRTTRLLAEEVIPRV